MPPRLLLRHLPEQMTKTGWGMAPASVLSYAKSMYIYVEESILRYLGLACIICNTAWAYKQEQEYKYEEQYCAVIVKNAAKEFSI